MAENTRLNQRIMELDDLHASLQTRLAAAEQTIENMEYDARESADYNTHGE